MPFSDRAAPASSAWAGRFITFEGIDGAGKSSHIDSLADWLRGQGAQVLLTREPGGTPLAEALRLLLLHQPMDGLTEALLMFAARRDHLQQQILPALARGQTVLCDRFTDASFAYQGGGHGLPQPVLQQLESWVQAAKATGLEAILTATGASTVNKATTVSTAITATVQPDLTLWFDLPAQLAAQRRAAARSPDRFETQDTAFFQRVRAAYAERAAQAPQRFAVIDGTGEREQVWARVALAVQRHAADNWAPS